MRFSIVIPTFNRCDLLRRVLAGLCEQDFASCEIIVVDDGSQDGTPAMVTTEYPDVRYVQQANRGPAAARNRGIGMATGEIIAFTDDDCLPPANWLSRLAEGYQRHPECAGVGGYLQAPDAVVRQSRVARYEVYMIRHGAHVGDTERVGGFECPAGGTNNMSYRRSVLDQVGGFDESFPYAAGEDADLKWRICERGYRLLYIPLRVAHLQSYDERAFRRQQVTRGRGAVHFERKHGQVPTRMRVLLRFAKRGLAFGPDLIRQGPEIAWLSLWGGWFDAWGQWLELDRLSREKS